MQPLVKTAIVDAASHFLVREKRTTGVQTLKDVIHARIVRRVDLLDNERPENTVLDFELVRLLKILVRAILPATSFSYSFEIKRLPFTPRLFTKAPFKMALTTDLRSPLQSARFPPGVLHLERWIWRVT